MKLTAESLKNRSAWEAKGYRLPAFDREAMLRSTASHPTWVHFGAGNIFKAFIADACQQLLDQGLCETGIIAVDRRPKTAVEAAAAAGTETANASVAADANLTVKVTLRSDGTADKSVIGSIAEHLCLFDGSSSDNAASASTASGSSAFGRVASGRAASGSSASGDAARLQEVFESPSLQMVSFTITEKGYVGNPAYWGAITDLLHCRYTKNKAPLAMVSMDNCSHNGDKLKAAIMRHAEGYGDDAFAGWLSTAVSFPWSMIDKITPGPDASVAAMLTADGLAEGTPFVNAEESEYLVIEDDFPNGRPCLEKAGVYFTDRETVEKTERMKVCTCLNPLHTGLAVYGCLLGFDRIWKEMKDEDLCRLVNGIGYIEGLPVVTDPLIIRPKDFIDTVVNVRLPNPFLPDAPQRIATDTSQKLPIRFGETIKSYLASEASSEASSEVSSVRQLRFIPLVFAGWMRYLMAIDDSGKAFKPSPDPLLAEASEYVADFTLGDQPEVAEIRLRLEPLLRADTIFGVDLIESGLADIVCGYFRQMLAGPGAVRETLHKAVTDMAGLR